MITAALRSPASGKKSENASLAGARLAFLFLNGPGAAQNAAPGGHP
jgi:hypothetical protein